MIYQLNGFCMADIDFISKLLVMDFFSIRKHDSKIFLSLNLTKKFSCKSNILIDRLLWSMSFVVFICYFFNTFLNEGSICNSRYIGTLFFAKCSCVVLVCLIPAPILFAVKPKKVRFFVYLGNRQIIGAVLSCHAFELNSPNMLSWKCRVLLFKYIVWDKKCCF